MQMSTLRALLDYISGSLTILNGSTMMHPVIGELEPGWILGLMVKETDKMIE